METDQNELRCPKCMRNEAQTVTPAASSAAPKSKALTFCCHQKKIDHGGACTANKPSSLHVSPNKGVKMKTQQKKIKKWWHMAQDMSIYGMMFRKHSHVSTKFTQINYVKSSDLIKPPEEFFQKHLQQIPSSLRLPVEKVQVIQPITSAKPWSAAARSARRNR